MLSIKITIEPVDEPYDVEVRIERFEDGRWKFFDMYRTTSQAISSTLIWEREQSENGVFNLILEDNRKKFVLV